ncbi:MAG TPA: hypothetical protein VEC56_10965 [Candidatus Krumholzibacteria bacterium]|nr:hypothetical protein [Candidatus Krumholzibacteria bacterium]
MKRVILLLLLLSACEDDPAQPQGNQRAQTFQALTTREAVLNNLELAWTKRNVDKIDELLDDDFTFYFSQGDVGGGLPPSWGRAAELAATTALFISNSSPPPSGPVCTRVLVDIALDDAIWTEVPGPVAALGEVWYSATVSYTATFEMEPDDTYITVPGATAEFIVRQVEDDQWRLVEWHDLPGDAVGPAFAAAVGESTWGSIKYLYVAK